MGVLDGKAAIVTGAGQGIGRAIALRLARDGAAVAVADLNAETAAQVADEIARAGGRSLALRTDVTAAADRDRMVRATLDRFGRIDILVNNAGIIRVHPPLEPTEEDWDITMAVNAKAVYFCSVAVLRHMMERGSGKIVNIASMAAKLGSPIAIDYNASKAAVVAITRNLAMAAAPYKVNINAVCPGIVDTAMWDLLDSQGGPLLGLGPGEFRRSRVASIPLGRIETPEDVAGVVAFLCGPDADYMTGQAINVTGGLVFH